MIDSRPVSAAAPHDPKTYAGLANGRMDENADLCFCQISRGSPQSSMKYLSTFSWESLLERKHGWILLEGLKYQNHRTAARG